MLEDVIGAYEEPTPSARADRRTPQSSLVVDEVPTTLESQKPCEAAADPDAWFPEDGNRGKNARLNFAAKVKEISDLCATCPIAQQCFEDAIERREAYGIWGGVLFRPGTSLEAKRRQRRQVATSQSIQGDHPSHRSAPDV